MDRRQLPAVLFLTMSTATMCIAARPAHAAASVLGHGAWAGRPGAVGEIRRSWESHGKIPVRMSQDIPRPQTGSGAAGHPAVTAVPLLSRPGRPFPA